MEFNINLKQFNNKKEITREEKYRNLRNRTRRQKFKTNKHFKLMSIIILLVIAVVFVLILFTIIRNIFGIVKTNVKNIFDNTKVVTESTPKNSDEYYENLVSEYLQKIDKSEINNVLYSYKNLGIVKCDGYINFRSEPDEKNTRSIIGLMNDGAACDVIELDVKGSSVYAKVKSGGMTGYIAKKYLVTGQAAIDMARQDIKLRGIVLVDKLRMRSAPTTDGDTEIGTTYKGERYVIVSLENGWAKVEADNIEGVTTAYINADEKYLSVGKCLNEARTQDLKSDVLNYYDNLGVSIARDYVNIRKTAKANGTICGKLPGKAGCNILGESGNFYKIKSGLVTGYVSKEYIATGKRAEDLAIQYADLRAIIKTGAMRVRTGPGTGYKQWTRVTKEETYIVTEQLDGWVAIEIDGSDSSKGTNKGYISTSKNYVEVRYALDQAIQFTVAATTTTTSTRGKIKNTALKYIGGRYVWGGNNLSTGVDCSGFVQAIYKQFGISLPRVSKEQAKRGTAVSSANKKVGDLIFYANSSGIIDHVGIYIGNNQIVHAASSRTGIRISAWNYREPSAIRNVLGNK